MKNRTISLTKIMLLTAFFSVRAEAGDVKMFSDQPPSAAELGNILFSKQPNASATSASKPKMKMRSISFGKPAAVAAVAEPQETLQNNSDNAVGLPIKFAYNSSEILPESKPFLDEIGKMLSLDEFSQESLVIEGHTDARGSDKYNRFLSERRADSVKSYLVGKFQIPSDRLFAMGKGESSPLAGKNPNDGVNRRVQFYRAP